MSVRYQLGLHRNRDKYQLRENIAITHHIFIVVRRVTPCI